MVQQSIISCQLTVEKFRTFSILIHKHTQGKMSSGKKASKTEVRDGGFLDVTVLRQGRGSSKTPSKSLLGPWGPGGSRYSASCNRNPALAHGKGVSRSESFCVVVEVGGRCTHTRAKVAFGRRFPPDAVCRHAAECPQRPARDQEEHEGVRCPPGAQGFILLCSVPQGGRGKGQAPSSPGVCLFFGPPS